MAESPAGASPHLEFQNTIEGALLRTVGADLTPDLKAKLRQQGLDLDKPLLPAYPAEDFHRWLRTVSAHLWPRTPEAEAVRALGRRTTSGLAETILGKAVKMSSMLLGPRRSLHRATRTFRTNNNYIEVNVVERSPQALELTFNEVHGLPTYYQGVLEGAISLMNAKNPRVTLLEQAAPGARYLVEWEE
jgi:uncharacterized protein (TIGR02265 family)